MMGKRWYGIGRLLIFQRFRGVLRYGEDGARGKRLKYPPNIIRLCAVGRSTRLLVFGATVY